MSAPSLGQVGHHLAMAGLGLAAWASAGLARAVGAALPGAEAGVPRATTAHPLEAALAPELASGGAKAADGPGEAPQPTEPEAPMAAGDWDPVGRAIAEERAALAMALQPWLRAWPALVQAQAAGRLPPVEALWPLWRLGVEAYVARSGLRFEGEPGAHLPWSPRWHEGVGLAEGAPVEVLSPGLILGDRPLWRAAVRPLGEGEPKGKD